jgi:predicted transcriptional regulator
MSVALGSLETEVMQTLWQAGRPLTVRETLESLNRDRSPVLAYTTVLTVLGRLTGKGALSRSAKGRGHAYVPVVPDEAALAVGDVLRTYGDQAVKHFMAHVGADPALRDRLVALLEKAQ